MRGVNDAPVGYWLPSCEDRNDTMSLAMVRVNVQDKATLSHHGKNIRFRTKHMRIDTMLASLETKQTRIETIFALLPW
jgi:hypothetical protein